MQQHNHISSLYQGRMMISPKKLIKIVREWQKSAALGRKRMRISLPTADTAVISPRKSVAEKGHFVIYTMDGRRFMLPLSYLSSPIFRELLKMSEDAFGLPDNRRITLPCDLMFMEYIISLIEGHVSENVEKTLLVSMGADRCSTASFLDHQHSNQQILLHGC